MKQLKIDLKKVEFIKQCLMEAASILQNAQDVGNVSIDDILDVEEDIEHARDTIKKMEVDSVHE